MVEIPAAEEEVTVVCCGNSGDRSAILRSLYNRVPAPVPSVTGCAENASCRGGLSRRVVAYLPPPGREVFSGATVGEELAFGAEKRLLHSGNAFGCEVLFLRHLFEPISERSVWELSSAERRLLLMASQAALNPSLWLCDEPLACLDGSMRRRVLGFLAACGRSGAAVLAASVEPAVLAPVAGKYVVLNDEGCVGMVLDGSGLPLDGAGSTTGRPASLWFTGIVMNH